MYNNIIFDVYGTLVDIHTDEKKDEIWHRLSEVFNSYNVYYKADKLQRQYIRQCKLQYKRGLKKYDFPEIDVIEAFKAMAKKKFVIITHEQARTLAQLMRTLSIEYIFPYSGVESTLKSLKERGKRLYILSNAQECFTQNELEKLDLFKYFDGVVYSSDYGVAKPSTAFFDVLIDKYKLSKENSIYVGNDPLSDVNGARNANIDCIWLKTNHTPADIIPNILPKYIIEKGDIKALLDIID